MKNEIIEDIKQIISNFTQSRKINNLETTISIASYSTSNNEYMTNSDDIVINGDILKDIYNSKYNFNNRPKSADAIYKFENGNIYIIEFKNDEPNKDNIYKYFAKNALTYKEYKFKDLNTLQEILFKESFACTQENFNEYIIPELNKEQN